MENKHYGTSANAWQIVADMSFNVAENLAHKILAPANQWAKL